MPDPMTPEQVAELERSIASAKAYHAESCPMGLGAPTVVVPVATAETLLTTLRDTRTENERLNGLLDEIARIMTWAGVWHLGCGCTRRHDAIVSVLATRTPTPTSTGKLDKRPVQPATSEIVAFVERQMQNVKESLREHYPEIRADTLCTQCGTMIHAGGCKPCPECGTMSGGCA